MLCLILILGGLLIMMGQHDRSEALFSYFRLGDQVPESHLLRQIDRHISTVHDVSSITCSLAMRGKHYSNHGPQFEVVSKLCKAHPRSALPNARLFLSI